MTTVPFIPLTKDHCRLASALTEAQITLRDSIHDGFMRWKNLLGALGEQANIIDAGLFLFVSRFYVEASIWANNRHEIKGEPRYYDGPYGFLDEFVRADA